MTHHHAIDRVHAARLVLKDVAPCRVCIVLVFIIEYTIEGTD
jgi:hypothetical protein